MIGRSRGGWTTKVHALTHVVGRPYALMLTPGNVSDVKAAPALLERADACAICWVLGATMQTGYAA